MSENLCEGGSPTFLPNRARSGLNPAQVYITLTLDINKGQRDALFLDFGSDTTVYRITKTEIPFSVCVALNFYNATFTEFSYESTCITITEPLVLIAPLHLLEFSGR